ncbi:ubiquitin-like protein Pup [Amycolatopsis japonica]|uniref:ubiquitin-like protein Pup n=1 Tax=Amycolatopsis japonica TaxID=208439 RepID=UPI00366EA7AB
MSRKQVRPSGGEDEEPVVQQEEHAAAKKARDDDLDRLIDEMDDLLPETEEEADVIVRQYVQKGGQ